MRRQPKNQLKYDAILSRYDGKFRGKWFRMCCCFHNERTPSMDVDRDSGGFHCWGCGRTGFIVEVIRKVERVSESAAKRMVSQRSLVQMQGVIGARREKPSFLDEEDSLELFTPIKAEKYVNYLKERGIDLKMAKKYEFRQGSPIEWGWNNRIVFPIRDLDGNLASLEGRTIADDPRRYRKWTGSKSTLGVFGIDKIAKKDYGKPLIGVEGAFDSLSVVRCGYNSVAISCSDISQRQINQIRRVTDYPIIILDGVKPGTEEERAEVLNRIDGTFRKSFSKYKVIEIPYANTDPNDLLKKRKLKKFLNEVVK